MEQIALRAETKTRLPTREMIDQISDLNALLQIQDEVTSAAKQIEVDLEFDTVRDEEWEARARRALAAHYTCNGHLTRRVAFIRRGGPAKQSDQDTKIRKKEAYVATLEAQAEAKRLKAEEDKRKNARLMAQYAAKQSWLAAFHRCAQQILEKPVMDKISGLAHKSLSDEVGA